jgi:hypothetical protein
LPRMTCQTFATGTSSGAQGGRLSRVMVSGTMTSRALLR